MTIEHRPDSLDARQPGAAESVLLERQRFLSEASVLLEASLDYETTLRQVSRLAVPRFADVCIVDLVEEGRIVRRVAATSTDPERERLLQEIQKRYPPAPDGTHPIVLAMRSGQPRLVEDVDDDDRSLAAQESEHLEILRRLGFTSYLIVPLVARGETLGALSLLSIRPEFRYTLADIPFVQDLGRRCSLAVMNAKLYREARLSEQEARARADELDRLSVELRRSEARFRGLTESLVEAVYETDMTQPHRPSGVCTYYSDQVEQVMGYPPDAWYEDDALWVKGVHPDDREWALRVLDELRDSGTTLDMEYRFVKPNGEVVWIEDRARLERSPDGAPLMLRGTNADVTARKRLEEQLQRSEREARWLYAAALAIGGELGVEARLERVLDAALELTGGDEAAVAIANVASGFVETIASRGLKLRQDHPRLPLEGSLFGNVVRDNAPLRSADAIADPRTWEPWRLEPFGVHSWLGVPLKDGGGAFGVLSVVSQEVDSFTEAHERLLESLAALTGAAILQERLHGESQQLAVMEERTRLARELHDSATQSLFSASMLAQAAQSLWSRNPERAKERLDRAAELCAAALAEMRALLFELRPEMVPQESLVVALQHVAARQQRDGIQVEIVAEQERRLPPTCEEAAYRIVREALHNSSKHASATHVWVRLAFQPDQLLVEVRDDGRGFDPAVRAGHGLGLTSMRERTEHLGGTLQIESAPGAGATIRACIPVPASGSERAG